MFTAHCGFGVTLTGVKTAADALKMFEKIDIVVIGPDFDPVSSDKPEGVKNWRGIDFCPPVHESPNGCAPSRDDQFEVYAYIKVFLEAKDVAEARKKLDQLYPDVVDDTFPPRFTVSAWDFSIQPSVDEELDPKNRITPPGAAAKEWQEARPIAAGDQISPTDPPLEAATKALRQFNRPLRDPFELRWVLKANGIDLSTEEAWEINKQLTSS